HCLDREGVSISDEGYCRARRELRERAQALQEAVREGRAHVGAPEAPALREAQRQAQAQDPGRSQEGQETGAVLRLVAAGWGAEWRRVRDLLAQHTRSSMGHERAQALEPQADLEAVRHALIETRELRAQVIKRLESYFQGAAAEHIFQERYVTVRHGRYVLPIRSEAKARFKGIVHDRSQSGATLFVEPEGVVEANNDLVQVAREE